MAENTNTEAMTSTEGLALLTPEALRDWLTQKPADQPIGYEGLSCRCPIAEFYAEKGISVEVGSVFDMKFRIVGREAVSLPSWAQFFARCVDEGDCSTGFPISEDDAEALGGAAYTDDCDKTSPFAVQGDDGWYQNVQYRPIAGRAAATLNDIIADMVRNHGDFVDSH